MIEARIKNPPIGQQIVSSCSSNNRNDHDNRCHRNEGHTFVKPGRFSMKKVIENQS
jgi:hypothetical protein